MDRIRDSIRATCSSPFRPSTALSFKSTPTCQINEDGPADTATLQDRAARKEMERVRLRKLLNQGKKKRRRLNGDKLPSSTNGASLGPVDGFRCQREGPHVPRKSRSVGYRRKSKSWKLIGLRLFSEQIELPIPSPLSQKEIEIEFEIAEVLSGLKTQVSSTSELLNNDLEKIRVEDEPKIKLERYRSYLGRSELSGNLPESTESKPPVKFIIDLNEPPPLESSLEGDQMEQLTTYSEDEMKVDLEEATVTRFVRPWKMQVNGEAQDLDLGSSDGNNYGRKQLIQKKQEGYSCTSIETDLLGPERISPTQPTQGISFCRNLNSIQHGKQGFKFYSRNVNQESNAERVSNLKIKDQVHDPLQSGRAMPAPLIFPLNQTRTTVMANHPLSHASNRNDRISYPLRASFLSVLPRNIYTNDGQNGEKNNQPLPFLDRQQHPTQMCLPIEIPHTTQAIADNRTLTGQTNMCPQTLFPLHSRSVVLMPSASSGGGGGGGGQWKYATKHVLKSVHAQCSSSNEAAGQALNFSIPHNQGFLDKVKFGSQIVPADPELLERHSEMIQRINQADSTLAAGNSPSWIKQSSFVLKSCSNISSAPNCNLSFSNHKAVNASQVKRVTITDKQHQQPTAAEVSNSFIYDRSPALQNPQLKLTIPSSHIHT